MVDSTLATNGFSLDELALLVSMFLICALAIFLIVRRFMRGSKYEGRIKSSFDNSSTWEYAGEGDLGYTQDGSGIQYDEIIVPKPVDGIQKINVRFKNGLEITGVIPGQDTFVDANSINTLGGNVRVLCKIGSNNHRSPRWITPQALRESQDMLDESLKKIKMEKMKDDADKRESYMRTTQPYFSDMPKSDYPS